MCYTTLYCSLKLKPFLVTESFTSGTTVSGNAVMFVKGECGELVDSQRGSRQGLGRFTHVIDCDFSADTLVLF